MQNPILISSSNWKCFKRKYDNAIKKNYTSATYIKHYVDTHGDICGWSSVFIKN